MWQISTVSVFVLTWLNTSWWHCVTDPFCLYQQDWVLLVDTAPLCDRSVLSLPTGQSTSWWHCAIVWQISSVFTSRTECTLPVDDTVYPCVWQVSCVPAAPSTCKWHYHYVALCVQVSCGCTSSIEYLWMTLCTLVCGRSAVAVPAWFSGGREQRVPEGSGGRLRACGGRLDVGVGGRRWGAQEDGRGAATATARRSRHAKPHPHQLPRPHGGTPEEALCGPHQDLQTHQWGECVGVEPLCNTGLWVRPVSWWPDLPV